MSETQSTTQAAGLFQRAHGKIVMLQRLDSQIASLLQQRKRVQSDLHEAQAEINDEFNRLMRESEQLPGSVLAEIASPTTSAEDEPAAAPQGTRRNGPFNVPSIPDETMSNRIDVSEAIP